MDAEFKEMIWDADPLVITIERSEVEAMDLSRVKSLFKIILDSKESASHFFERLDISFSGYDSVPDELETIENVRLYVKMLDQIFPFWIYFCTKYGLGLRCIMFCLLPPLPTGQRIQLTEEFKNEYRLLTERWFPAMNHLCYSLGKSVEEIEILSERFIKYSFSGPFYE